MIQVKPQNFMLLKEIKLKQDTATGSSIQEKSDSYLNTPIRISTSINTSQPFKQRKNKVKEIFGKERWSVVEES